jgi:large subunit ribosomal protein L31
MKKDIHPEYHKDAKVVCACGNEINTGSIMQEMRVEICAACHPFFTGQEKLVDTQGRVEKFKARAEQAVDTGQRKAAKQAKEERRKNNEA